jgi:2-polyprenyl-6-hydroxyphenyl methylase/3-demethylubiquinone-9 3-methyltransferase
MAFDPAAPLPGGLAAPGEFSWRGAGPTCIHEHVARPVVMALDRCGARSVLDLGCGNGWLTAALARCGFEVVGLDSSASGVAIASRMHPEIPFHQADALEPLALGLRGRFDAVLAVEIADHVAQPRRLLHHAVQALRPGGTMFVTVPYHGYLKNLGLALAGRFDGRWHALEDHGRLKFYSRHTLSTLLADCGLVELEFQTLGRLPWIARSMLVSGRVPVQEAGGAARQASTPSP